MTLEKFRILHSTLIEHYQFIEAHLEGIYACISGKTLVDGLKNVERDGMNRIIKEIKALEERKDVSVFSDDEYAQLQEILQRRNFWCHNCYYDLVFDRKTGGPKRKEDIQTMLCDLQVAETWRNSLFEKERSLLDSNRDSLLPAFEKWWNC